MRKFFLLLFALCGVLAMAQERERVSISIRGGLNTSSMGGSFDEAKYSIIDETYSMKYKPVVNFNLGAAVDVHLKGDFYLQPGLYYTGKGIKGEAYYKYGQNVYNLKQTYRLHYLVIPILASYKHDVSEAIRWEVNAGPYFAIGLKGKHNLDYALDELGIKAERTVKGDAFGEKEEWSDNLPPYYDGFLRRFDFGLSFGTGLLFAQHYFVGIKYDLGLSNIAKTDKGLYGGKKDYTMRNGVFSINVGYQF